MIGMWLVSRSEVGDDWQAGGRRDSEHRALGQMYYPSYALVLRYKEAVTGRNGL